MVPTTTTTIPLPNSAATATATTAAGVAASTPPPTHTYTTHAPPPALNPTSNPSILTNLSIHISHHFRLRCCCCCCCCHLSLLFAAVPSLLPQLPTPITLLTHQNASTNQSSNSHSSSLLEAQPHPCRLSPSCCFCCRCNKQEAREGI
jgi:hypothetical protein